MKREILFLIILLSLPMFLFAFRVVPESDYSTYHDVKISLYDLTLYDKHYTEKEWWQSQPIVNINFDGDEKYLSIIVKVLKQCGFLIGQGDGLDIYVESINDKFLYLNVSYKKTRFDNLQSLILLESDVESQLFQLFSTELGDFRKHLPKMILIKSDGFVETTAEFIYRGPEYYLYRTFDETITIETHEGSEEFLIPFKPVVMIDLDKKKFTLQLVSDEPVELFFDGERFISPVILSVEKGVHELKIGNETQYLYVIEDMEILLDTDALQSSLMIQLDMISEIKVYRDDLLIKRYNGKKLDFETTAGDIKLVVSREGYADYEERITLNPGKSILREISLKGKPGSLAFETPLNGQYDRLFMTDDLFVVSGQTDSIIVRASDYEVDGIGESVMALTNDFLVTRSNVYDNNLDSKFISEIPIVNAVETDRGLWLFLSDMRIMNMDTSRWVEYWIRVTDYLPVEMKLYEEYIAILDVFSRFILINSEYGYNAMIDERIVDATGIQAMCMASDSLIVDLKDAEGVNKRMMYFPGNMKYDISTVDYTKTEEKVVYRDGGFWQGEELLYAAKYKPLQYLYNDTFCLILTESSLKAFYLK